MELNQEVFAVESLTTTFGKSSRPSPLKAFLHPQNFVFDDTDRILVDISLSALATASRPEKGNIVFAPMTFELAGPRDRVFWDPATTKVAMCTCGGLAPGLNSVLQSLVNVLHDRYHVTNIFGVPFGYYGFSHDPESKRFRFGWRRLDSQTVQNLDTEAGSVLGSSRGNSDPVAIVDALVMRDINILFTIGGDGTLAGAKAIHDEIKKRNLPITIVGIPKTIDNDILWVSKSFGFETAVAKAVDAIKCAHTEAKSAFNGIGLVKLMGRNSGALTASAAAATSGIDFILVPEVEIVLEGEAGLLNHLVRKVMDKGYATVVVAEGAGQNLLAQGEKEFDASGNTKLKDIGRFLQAKILEEFKRLNIETTLKYIDPSYMLRAQPPSADDSFFCSTLGQHAAHAAMAGKTGVMIGYAHERFIHVPLQAVLLGKKQLDTNGPLWLSVLSLTGQPPQWK
jgi:6-phosphofructokinase 1